MGEIAIPTVYFDKPGKQNSKRTLEIARTRAQQLSMAPILVATTTGATGALAAELLQGLRVIAVTHSYGFKEADANELLAEHRVTMERAGAKILTCGHAFAGISRAVRKRLSTYEVAEIVAYTLRVFGEGMKVAAEITLMAADAGLVRTDELVIAVGGTGRGADTAIVLKPQYTEYFFDMKIQEILCLPYR